VVESGGTIATGPSGSALDGGGHSLQTDCQRQVAAVNASLEGQRSQAVSIRQFEVVVGTVDPESRSVRAVIATDSPSFSKDAKSGDVLYEVLRMDGVMLPDQIPLVDTHMMGSVRALLGSIRELEVRDGELIGRVLISSAEESIWQKVVEGHIRDISVRRMAFESVSVPPGQQRTVAGQPYTAPAARRLIVVTRWEPIEGSLTARGSDSRAKIL
jgi:hypothetical protein